MENLIIFLRAAAHRGFVALLSAALILSFSSLAYGGNGVTERDLGSAKSKAPASIPAQTEAEPLAREDASSTSPATKAKDNFSSGFQTVGSGFKNGVKATGRSFKKAGTTMGKGFKKAGTTMGRGFKKAGTSVAKGFTWLGSKIKGVFVRDKNKQDKGSSEDYASERGEGSLDSQQVMPSQEDQEGESHDREDSNDWV